MKIFLLATSLLFSILSFASTTFVEGTYENENEGCKLIVSVGDFFDTNVNRLIIEMAPTEITPWGAILTQTMDSAQEQYVTDRVVILDNAAGLGSYVVLSARFNTQGKVESFQAYKESPRGDVIGDAITCEEMELK